MARFTGAAAAMLLLLLFAPRAAHANGRFPAASQLVVFPESSEHAPGETFVLRTTFGILFSVDGGKNWDWVCERSVGFVGTEDPALGVLGGKTVLAGTFEGLSVTRDLGCTWSFAGGELTSQVAVDVTGRPGSTASAIALTSTYLRDDGGISNYANLLFATTDEGATWHRLGTSLPAYAVGETVDTAASDAARIYVSAYQVVGGRKEGLFYTSKDNGQSFTENVIELTPDEGAPFIAAVDPTNAERVYVRTTGETASRLLVTDDAGHTFREIFAGPPLLGFALSADGSKVWVGSSDGLYMASRQALTFVKRSSVAVQCLTFAAATLYACSSESSGFIVGASTDDGATFAPRLHLSTVRGPLACPADTPTATCNLEWPATRDQLGIALDAGADGGQPGAPASGDGGGGCSMSPNIRSIGAFFSILGAAVAAAAARRFAPHRNSRAKGRRS